MPHPSRDQVARCVVARFLLQQGVSTRELSEQLLGSEKRKHSNSDASVTPTSESEVDGPDGALPWWATWEGQMCVMKEVIQHPEVTAYPPRKEVLQGFLKAYFGRLEQAGTAFEASGAADEDVDEGFEIADDVIGYYTMLLARKGELIPSMRADTAAQEDSVEEDNAVDGDTMRQKAYDQMFFKTFHAVVAVGAGESTGQPLAVRRIPQPLRSTTEFVNVGLAVWPAGLVITELLRQALYNGSGAAAQLMLPSACTSSGVDGAQLEPLRIVELGAGVGLTASPALCHNAMRRKKLSALTTDSESNTSSSFSQDVGLCCLTDYQPFIIENCNMNIQLMDEEVRKGTIGRNEKEKLGVDASLPPCSAQFPRDNCFSEILDWTERERNATLLKEWRPNLILAADVVYDVEVIADLGATLKQALTLNSDDGNGSASIPKPKAVIVSTKRNEKTFGLFLESISGWCRSESHAMHSDELLRQCRRDAQNPNPSQGDVSRHVFQQLVDVERHQPMEGTQQDVDVSREEGGEGVVAAEVDVAHPSFSTSAVGDGFFGQYHVAMLDLIVVHVLTPLD